MSGETVVVVPPTETPTPEPVIVVAENTPAIDELAENVAELVEAKKDENTALIIAGLTAIGDQIATAFSAIATVLDDIRAATVEIAEEIEEEILPEVNTSEIVVEAIPEPVLTPDEQEAIEEVTERTNKKSRYFV